MKNREYEGNKDKCSKKIFTKNVITVGFVEFLEEVEKYESFLLSILHASHPPYCDVIGWSANAVA
ncbi:hypothetical protein RyT2_25640 [Pseudolactococcus yaeyamensis]